MLYIYLYIYISYISMYMCIYIHMVISNINRYDKNMHLLYHACPSSLL